MWCFINGDYQLASDLRISPFDHGFLYGLGFFETFRTYQGQPLFLQEHYARLQQALATYRIAMPYTMEQLKDIVKELNQREEGDGYFRLNVSAGEHDIGLKPQRYDEPNVILFRKPLMLAPAHSEKTLTFLQTVRNQPEQQQRFKSHHYGNNVLARFELPSLQQDEGVFVNHNGDVVEGVTSNIFWVKDGQIYTPSLATGALGGIMRQLILQMTTVIEGEFKPTALLEADEIFITTAIQGLVPIKQLENNNYVGREGKVYQQLFNAFEQVKKERQQC